MFFAESEFLPDLRTAPLDKVLAIRVLVNHELDDSLVWNAATVPIDETRDRRLDLGQLLGAVVHRQVEEQMAVHDFRLPAGLALACPYRGERDAMPMQPLVQTLA